MERLCECFFVKFFVVFMDRLKVSFVNVFEIFEVFSIFIHRLILFLGYNVYVL